MRKQIISSINRYFSDAEAMILLLLILLCVIGFYFFSVVLAPFIISVIIAFLLDALVKPLLRLKVPPIIAVFSVCILFFGALFLIGLLFLPILWDQSLHLLKELPAMVSRAHLLILDFTHQHLEFLSLEKFDVLFSEIDWKFGSLGHWVFSLSLASIPGFLSLLVYCILVPILVYFLLVDKAFLLGKIRQLFPAKLHHLDLMWQEIHKQIGHYVIGKLWEALIVAIVTYGLFMYYKLNYALILAIAVGLSCIIPWVGMVLVTVPLVIIAIFQWGLVSDLITFLSIYCLIMLLDANVLVPILFSEAMKMHPIVILLSVIFFGHLWGIVGVFFAIPLAVLIKVMIQYWPVAKLTT